ncbi:hypothetical protein DYH09_27015 [bacterium CPR1]|nr:hypothetical protein [bacterium CPR1]
MSKFQEQLRRSMEMLGEGQASEALQTLERLALKHPKDSTVHTLPGRGAREFATSIGREHHTSTKNEV